ncbi:MAG: succinate dehydrogenase, hydrophobic membrane anchor protein [Deltaproteobacteria bacterium]|nr:succinate dehydrogenase, hydrophobic membrane anchor protein [Deltaproteobacteria bacterium]
MQRISGIALLVLLVSHFWVTHYFPGGDVTYEKVAARLVHPGWKFLNLFFLSLALFHGMNGGWTALEDYLAKGWLRVTLFSLILIATLSLLIWGALTIITFQPPRI